MIGRTFRSNGNSFVWNTRRGKGSKPAKVSCEEIEEFVSLLRSKSEAVLSIAYEKGWVSEEESVILLASLGSLLLYACKVFLPGGMNVDHIFMY